jgi:hypothetical protein
MVEPRVVKATYQAAKYVSEAVEEKSKGVAQIF